MTLQQVLNTDVRVLVQTLRQGLRWWTQELAEMAPAALRQAKTPRSTWLAQLRDEDGPFRLWRDGVVQPLAETDGAARSVDLLLPPGAVLGRDVTLPRLPPRDLTALVTVNMDRQTPFRADQVYFDLIVLGPAAEDGKQRIRLGILARDRAARLLARARAENLTIERMGVAAQPDGFELQFDFMRAIQAETGANPNRRRVWLWAGCALLMALNLGVAIARDMADTRHLQQAEDLLHARASAATRLRQVVQAEQAARITLLTRRSVNDPLRILDATTKALPAGTWVQRFEWNGRAVRLVGFKSPDFNLIGALQSRALRNPRSLASDMTTPTATKQTPFDVMADSVARAP